MLQGRKGSRGWLLGMLQLRARLPPRKGGDARETQPERESGTERVSLRKRDVLLHLLKAISTLQCPNGTQSGLEPSQVLERGWEMLR